MNYSCIPTNESAATAAEPSLAGNSSVSRRNFIKLCSVGASTLALQACGGGGGGSTSATAPIVTVPPPSTDPIQITPPPVTPPPVTPPPVTPPPVTPPPVTPTPVPVWSMIPTLSFVQGVKSSIPIAQYVSITGAALLGISLNNATLPAGVTFNAVAQAFDYDGFGAAATASGFILTATGG